MAGYIQDCRSGPQLFCALRRLFAGALTEEYCNDGVWDIDCLRLDPTLIEAHRVQAVTAGIPSILLCPIHGNL